MTDDVNDNNDKLEELLGDQDLMEYFVSRDPNRKKIDPFLTEDAQKDYTGKSSVLTKVEKRDDDENTRGVSYSQHQKHVNDVARNYTWVGISVGILFAIIVTVSLNIT